ncbi:hypothetical protein BU25DRAFT_146518 [Macroventuria anomochaeta]|uniref:Uncharacterized protein n=1 Tax=Macroventuria anomochaeta TaxID=301207 RepID=A0ACB6SE12_9PLEO|nr:uncharacterized protein BU25DRAFT_146518 [Macroventuria anomochaeta]KAF2632284.1 hypothetical protein BU25DRAFT_146518 [Macroventuria anomochaeta]
MQGPCIVSNFLIFVAITLYSSKLVPENLALGTRHSIPISFQRMYSDRKKWRALNAAAGLTSPYRGSDSPLLVSMLSGKIMDWPYSTSPHIYTVLRATIRHMSRLRCLLAVGCIGAYLLIGCYVARLHVNSYTTST